MMSADLPNISVILAVNRDDGFLQEAIESVLNQTHRNFELIIVANCCTDELWTYLNSFSDSRIKLHRTSIGQLPFNLNLAIEEAQGKYVARMDADDVCEPKRLACQFAFMEAHPEVDVLGTEYVHIDEKGQSIGKPSALNHSHEDIIRRLPYESCMPHPTVMFKRASVLAASGYAYGLYAEDWDLWLRLARRQSRFANLPQPLLRYRIHGAQSTSHSALRRNIANVIGLLTRELILTGRPAFAAGIFTYLSGTLLRATVAQLRARHA
ncbi:glycosyltransferase [Massilia sp. MS-15]|uniref:glycosyltransferase n=1 Tax=Massilia sp. MS-15 TaxID=2878200 RepID=UPI001CD7E353|nr:glycosyltransferase [Massilia sp. MS-15]MCA1248835.1 glycosyltransferase [Massilia sp. MS-15]